MKVKIGCASSLQEYKGLEFSLKANSQYVWDPLLFACILLCRPLCKLDFPGGSDGKSICLQCGRSGFNPWVGKIHWRRKWQPTLVFLPGEFRGQRSLAGYSPQGHKEVDTTEWVTLALSFRSKKWANTGRPYNVRKACPSETSISHIQTGDNASIPEDDLSPFLTVLGF